MSDPKSYGDPVEEPTPVDDVVGRANEGLADAEAAGRDAVAEGSAPEPQNATPADAPVTSEQQQPATEAVAQPDGGDDDAEAAYAQALADYPPAATEHEVSDTAATAYAAPAAGAAYVAPSEPTHAADTAYVPSAEPVYGGSAETPSAPAETSYAPAAETAYVPPAAAPAPQPIFVQAPEPPQPRGNRAAAGGIGLLAALAFAVLYLGAWLGFGAITGDVTGSNVADVALDALTSWALWTPVVVFFLAFWLLGAIINRGRWGFWVVFGIFVGVAAYAGHILGALLQEPFWRLTAGEGADLVTGELLAPLAIAAFIFGRELTIWFGAWAAARGKRVTELNIEAQREYERTLEAGPQLYQQ